MLPKTTSLGFISKTYFSMFLKSNGTSQPFFLRHLSPPIPAKLPKIRPPTRPTRLNHRHRLDPNGTQRLLPPASNAQLNERLCLLEIIYKQLEEIIKSWGVYGDVQGEVLEGEVG